MSRGIVVLGIVALVLCACVTNGLCEAGKAVDPNAMDVLTNILKSKGILSNKEAAALEKKTTGAESGQSIKALVDLLQHKGLVNASEANHVKQVLAQKPTETQKAARAILVVPRDKAYEKSITNTVVSSVKQDINKQVENDIVREGLEGKLAANLPPWLQKIKFSGDIRLRYEGDYFPSGNGTSILNPSSPSNLFDSTYDRNREQLRLRLGMEDQISDQLMVGVRVAGWYFTVPSPTPVSTNEVIGGTGDQSVFFLDQAYIRYTPFCDGLTIWAGRIPNPWLYTDLVWSDDINYEGVAGKYEHNVTKDLAGFLTAGAFPIGELISMDSQHDKWLFGGQTGIEYKPDLPATASLAVALYDYQDITGVANPVDNPEFYDYTAPPFMQRGNTVFNIAPTGYTPVYALAAHFRDIDLIGKIDYDRWAPIHAILTGEYVKNIAFDAQEVSELSGRPECYMQNDAYRAGLQVGYPETRRFMEWNLFGYYEYIGTDSVLDAYNNADFHLGGTNCKGWVFGANLGITKNVWVTVEWMTTDQISPFQNSNGPFSIDVFQFDTNAAF